MIEKKTVSPGTVTKPAAAVHQPGNTNTNSINTTSSFFNKENYKWMLAGALVIILGMFVMSGGKSKNANVFDQKEVYSTTRITIAPLLITIGLGLEVFAIFKKPRA